MIISDRLYSMANQTSNVDLSLVGVGVMIFTFINPSVVDDTISDNFELIESYLTEYDLVKNYKVVWTVEPDITTNLLAKNIGLSAPVTNIITDDRGKIIDISTGLINLNHLNYILEENGK